MCKLRVKIITFTSKSLQQSPSCSQSKIVACLYKWSTVVVKLDLGHLSKLTKATFKHAKIVHGLWLGVFPLKLS